MAGPLGSPSAQSLHERTRRSQTRSRTESPRPPSRSGDGPTIAALLIARTRNQDCGSSEYQAAKLLIAQAGSKRPRELTSADVIEVDEAIHRNGRTHSTRATRSTGVRALLRWLWTQHGAPKLDDDIRRYPGVRPRNITATDAERAAILALAPPHMRLFILLCSDLAIRAGTVGILAPQHYDPHRGTLRFTTKKAEKVTLPVTAEIAELLARCSLDSSVPFVRQLWRAEQTHGKRPYPRANVRSATLSAKFRKLKDAAGIERKLTPHDLRRTTAVAMLQHTGDVRDVQALLGHRSLQSTIWYLDHDLRPVSLEALEIIKRPYLLRKEKSA